MALTSSSDASEEWREGFASTVTNPQGQESRRVSPVPFSDPSTTASEKVCCKMPDLDKLLELLKESKREHTHCEDVWYCCRACRHNHMLVEGEHIVDGIIERAGTYR